LLHFKKINEDSILSDTFARRGHKIGLYGNVKHSFDRVRLRLCACMAGWQCWVSVCFDARMGNRWSLESLSSPCQLICLTG